MRFFSTVGTLLLVLVGTTCADETPTIKIVDAVGPVLIGAPPVGDKPKASERQIAPGITKEFRFLGADGSVAVLISTKIRPDLPKDDRVLDRVKPRYERMQATFGKEESPLRIFGEAPNRVFEFALFNNNYTDAYPHAVGHEGDGKELKAIGISQYYVAGGRMFECALHLPNDKGLSRKKLLAHAQKLCTQWRESHKIDAKPEK